MNFRRNYRFTPLSQTLLFGAVGFVAYVIDNLSFAILRAIGLALFPSIGLSVLISGAAGFVGHHLVTFSVQGISPQNSQIPARRLAGYVAVAGVTVGLQLYLLGSTDFPVLIFGLTTSENAFRIALTAALGLVRFVSYRFWVFSRW